MRLCFTIFSALIACCIAKASTLNSQLLFVQLDQENVGELHVVWPATSTPRSVVVVIPGSGGLSDPNFNIGLAAPTYNSNIRGGLTKALAEAGYVAIYYNHRGIRPLRKCVKGSNLEQRIDSYLAHCMDRVVRSNTHFDTVTQDLIRILREVSKNQIFKGLPVVALAYSEGLHHVAQAAAAGGFRLDGVVSPGGPTVSMSEVARFQLQRKYYILKASAALRKCKKRVMPSADVPLCTGLKNSLQLTQEFQEALGTGLISQAKLNTREKYWKKFYDDVMRSAILNQSQPYNPGIFMGREVVGNWAGDYFFHMATPTVKPSDSLRINGIPLIYLMGTLDKLVPLSPPMGCFVSDDFIWPGQQCLFKMIPDVDHTLSDGGALFPPKSTRAIVESISAITRYPNHAEMLGVDLFR